MQNKLALFVTLISIGFFVSCSGLRTKNEAKKHIWEYKIPKLDKIIVDGNDSDWNKQGLELKILANNKGEIKVNDSFDPLVKIGWTTEGLSLGFWVKTDAITAVKKHPWKGDSIEIFITNGIDGLNHCQLAFPVIFDSNGKTAEPYLLDNRGERKTLALKLKYLCSGKKTQTGYFMEFMMPFDVINVKPNIASEVALNIKINHLGNNKKKTGVAWHPIGGSNQLRSRRFMNKLTLSKTCGKTPAATVKYHILDNKTLKIFIISDKKNVNQTVSLRRNDQIIEKELQLVENKAISEFSIILPKNKKEYTKNFIYFNEVLIEEINELESKMRYKEIKKIHFLDKVNAYLAADISSPFPKGNVVFTGHSQIDFWDQIYDDMKPFKILNRGIGGTKANSILTYLDELILKHKPSIIIYFIGGNDISIGRKTETVINDIKTFCDRVHKELPNAKIALIEHPPRLDHRGQKRVDAFNVINNGEIKLAKERDYVYYLKIADKLLAKDKNIPSKFLRTDNIHYSAEGYKAFAPVIHSFLSEHVKK